MNAHLTSMPPTLKLALLSTFWSWCEEEGFITYLQVVADHGTRLPPGFVEQGTIVLNISSDATGHLHFGQNDMSFQARFSGKVEKIYVPAERISAIFIRDSTVGLSFPISPSPAEEGTATLSIVSSTKDSDSTKQADSTVTHGLHRLQSVKPQSKKNKKEVDSNPDTPSSKPKGPTLRKL